MTWLWLGLLVATVISHVRTVRTLRLYEELNEKQSQTIGDLQYALSCLEQEKERAWKVSREELWS